MPTESLDKLVTYFHDRLCYCGGRCYGWESDKVALEKFLVERYGSSIYVTEGLFDD